MEDTFTTRSLSHRTKKDAIQDQIRRIQQAAELAQEKIDFATAHNEDILYAVEIVEQFLKRKHRLCYGGQAINAHLPDRYKFYDPKRSIPDYDFFTPAPEQDLRQLVNDLKKAGFQEISAREGIHEGTVKLYVDYVPVADMTEMEPALYRILSKREARFDGISYVDANTLKMMMYLELSRPRGEVDRWPKVYERLMLLNLFSRTHSTRRLTLPTHTLTQEQTERILQWTVQRQRVFAGLDLVSVYRQALQKHKKNTEWIVRSRHPILLYSPMPADDATEIQNLLESTDTSPTRYRIEHKKGHADILPAITTILRDKRPVVFLIHQTACHSYYQYPLRSTTHQHQHQHQHQHTPTIRVASVDTLITLYFSIALLNLKMLPSMEALAQQLVEISIQMRKKPKDSPFPFISLNCAGHQTTLTSLIRAKVQRMTQRKARLKEILDPTRSLDIAGKTRQSIRKPRPSKRH